MKISFIIPCYNVEKYIERCVLSIINLNEDKIEIIAINDGSTDNTGVILKNLKNKYNIKVIEMDNPSGYAGLPRNKGLEVAKSEYIAFIDPDDYYLNDEIMLSYNEHKGYDIIINSFQICNENGKIVDKIKLKNGNIDRTKFLWKQIGNVCNQRSLYKREFIEQNKIKFYEDCRAQDLLFLYECYVHGSTIYTTDKITTMYVDERTNSISSNINKSYIESSIIAYERFYLLIKNKLCAKEVESAVGEHFIGYYLKVKNDITPHQIELLKSTQLFEYIKEKTK